MIDDLREERRAALERHLKKAVAAGAIDTVIVAMVDMQGRLVGKRVRVTGKLERFKDRPQILIESPDQVRVVE